MFINIVGIELPAALLYDQGSVDLYLENPTGFYREHLREKYQRVPEHEPMYLGDMDSKDWDCPRILYRPNEKREVEGVIISAGLMGKKHFLKK